MWNDNINQHCVYKVINIYTDQITHVKILVVITLIQSKINCSMIYKK